MMQKLQMRAIVLLSMLCVPAYAQDPYSIGKNIGQDLGNIGVNDAIQGAIDDHFDNKDAKQMRKIEAEQAIKTQNHIRRMREGQKLNID